MSLKLYRRKGRSNWILRGTVAGRRVHETTGTDRKDLADALRIRRETEILERHALGRKATITFAEAALTYAETGGETRFLWRIADYFGPDKPLSAIDNEAVNQAARKLYPGAAPATINRQLITPISAVVNMAAMNDLCSPRVFRRRKGDKARLRWLTPEEAERLISAARADKSTRHLVRALGFLLGGGMRTGEAISLTVQTYYPKSGEAFLAQTKNGDARMIRLPARAVELTLEEDLPELGAVLRTPRGRAYAQRENGGGQLQAAFNKARDAAGLGPDVTPHVLRHTWATWYYAQTRDFGGLMDLGGWRKADMANRYRKLAPEDLADRLLDHGWDFTRESFAEARRRDARPSAEIRELKRR